MKQAIGCAESRRLLKGLEDMIDVSYTHWFMGENGWTFKKDPDGIVGDKLFGSDFMYELYIKADPHYTGRVTVPTLWDKQQNTIVSNESADLIRMFNTAFDEVGAAEGDYYPEGKRAEIDEINERVYHTVNNGVYKAGFATAQDAYEEAVFPLFESLDWLDEKLGKSRFLTGQNREEKAGDPLSGYSVVEASDIDAALDMARRNPIFALGGTIEVAECLQM